MQHLLILVKLLLSVLIPDEPDWIRKKREHIEFKSLQALREQVGQQACSASRQFCLFLTRLTVGLLLFSRGPTEKNPPPPRPPRPPSEAFVLPLWCCDPAEADQQAQPGSASALQASPSFCIYAFFSFVLN